MEDGGAFTQVFVHHTINRIYLLGTDSQRKEWRLLKFDCSVEGELNVQEDPATYTRQQTQQLLASLHEGMTHSNYGSASLHGWRAPRALLFTGVADLDATSLPSSFWHTNLCNFPFAANIALSPFRPSSPRCTHLPHLATPSAGNLAHGGCRLVTRAHAVIGCFRFLGGYYLLLVTEKRDVGILCGKWQQCMRFPHQRI
jgi:hypothetical protein